MFISYCACFHAALIGMVLVYLFLTRTYTGRPSGPSPGTARSCR
jgi:hypothetical protein